MNVYPERERNVGGRGVSMESDMFERRGIERCVWCKVEEL